MRSWTVALLSSLLGLAEAGTTIWSGSFNAFATSADFDKCELSDDHSIEHEVDTV